MRRARSPGQVVCLEPIEVSFGMSTGVPWRIFSLRSCRVSQYRGHSSELAQRGARCLGRRSSTARRLLLAGVSTRCPARPSRIGCPSPSASYFSGSRCFLRRAGGGGLPDAANNVSRQYLVENLLRLRRAGLTPRASGSWSAPPLRRTRCLQRDGWRSPTYAIIPRGRPAGAGLGLPASTLKMTSSISCLIGSSRTMTCAVLAQRRLNQVVCAIELCKLTRGGLSHFPTRGAGGGPQPDKGRFRITIPRSGSGHGEANVTLFSDVPGSRPGRGKGADFVAKVGGEIGVGTL
jgi:hypothetical protein